MTNDINLTGDVYTSAIIAADLNNLTDYFEGTYFQGDFDGKGFKITGLTINNSNASFLGLFGFTLNAKIKNLELKDVSISGKNFVCGLVGSFRNGNITNCCVTGNINASGVYVGGMIAETQGSVLSKCYSKCSVNGLDIVGGLAGLVESYCDVLNCYSISNVNGRYYIGGLIGYCHANSVSCSYFIGNVTARLNYVGGLVGENSGSNISNCKSQGTVKGINYVAGLAGTNIGIWSEVSNVPGDISNCYSACDINGKNYCGGLVGSVEQNCNLSNSFWNIDLQTHGITNTIGYGSATNVRSLTTSQMKQKASYTTSPANWDFYSIWNISDNHTYPYLKQCFSSDINQDSKVNYDDFFIFSSVWHIKSNESSDINQNGEVDYFDLNILAQNWLTGI